MRSSWGLLFFHWIDIWSFGIFAFEVIAQQEPHAEVDPIQVGRLIRDEGLTPHLPDTCPTELASLIKSCWNIDPKQRPTVELFTPQFEKIMSQI
jgi:serine/threonine protein kinase